MDLLKYEFEEYPKGSFNYDLKELVRNIRFYSTQVSIEQFKAALPMLKLQEKRLQDIDVDLGGDRRNYIQEIMDELEQERVIKEDFMNEIGRCSKVIMKEFYNDNFSMDDVSIEFISKGAVYWLEFNSFKGADVNRSNMLKEIARAICYKFGVVFIDKSKDMLA